MLEHVILAHQVDTTIGSVLTVSISFLLLLLLLKKFAWGPVTEILQKREEKIANDLDAAEESRIKAAEMEKQRESQLQNSRTDAAEIIKSAKENGEVSRQNILAETQVEVSKMKEKAKNDIRQEQETALATVKDEVAELSIQLVAKILEQELTPETQNTLISQYIDDLGSHHETE
ncbi:F-type H+-transporting ATPase subunit b [Enterococcus sp. PF1-24]|uniref:F0F1 ATP synthase subunit B n=1 Tax=unclassified Enterococcus TaxID=2608891 RepID=UPI002476B3C6|nr:MULTISPECIES: F0F1 ATP synthase subunit B [unclassified Enterococcus]MDH6364613.1 F-type H+-transporting ATPase subunit b [Enterococcus sp. PFB1-1]MDH6401714.1 F-type H+-transporting ATPase subunit b [Enterococcus sp. PF1-24]